MGGEMYCDGGIVASNPAAVAIHEARTLYPHVPIELVVSIGTGGKLGMNEQTFKLREKVPNINVVEPCVVCLLTGCKGFTEQKSAPRIGWDGIIGQIVNSACDGEQIHHILEDILGEGGTARLGKSSVSKTRYYRLNPIVGSPDAFPIDVSDPEKLARLSQITKDYLQEPEQRRKLQAICDILEGGRRWRNVWPWQS
jgi:calcium-independent phospholipase A2-gamma